MSDTVSAFSYIESLAQTLLDRVEAAPKNAKKKPVSCCPGHTKLAPICDTLHVMKQARLLKALTRRSHVLIRRSKDVGLDGVLSDMIQDVISLCQAHTCLNTDVVRILSYLSHIILRLAERDSLADYENYGRMYFFFKKTFASLEALAASFSSKFSSAGSQSVIVTELAEISTRLRQSLLAWRSNEHSIFCSVFDWLRRLEQLEVPPFNQHLSNIISSYRAGFQKANAQNALILSDLQSLFRRMYGARRLEVKVQLFGSRVSSLGGSDSDLDISISFYCIKPDRSISWIPVIVNNKKYRQNKTNEGTLHTKDILYALNRELGKRTNEYRVLEVIPWSRIPIIRFVHLSTGVEIDLCVGNELGVQNTLLLRQYQQTDESIHNALLMVKYWAKSRNMNNARIGLPSSFSWSLLTLYAMQHSDEQPHCPSFHLTNYAANLIQEYKSPEKVNTALYCGDQEMFTLESSYSPSSKSLIETLLAIMSFYGVDYNGSFQFFRESVDLQNGARDKQRQNEDCLESEDDAEDPVDEQDDDDEDGDVKDTEVSQTKSKGNDGRPKSSRAKWRMQIVDPFDKGDLSRVIRSESHQQYFMSEIRRALYCIVQCGSLDMAFEPSTCSDLLCSKCHRIGHVAGTCSELEGINNSNAGKNDGKKAERETTPGPKGPNPQHRSPRLSKDTKHQSNQSLVQQQPASTLLQVQPLPQQPQGRVGQSQIVKPPSSPAQVVQMPQPSPPVVQAPPPVHIISSAILPTPAVSSHSETILEPSGVAVIPGRRQEAKFERKKRSHSNSELKQGESSHVQATDISGGSTGDPTQPLPRLSQPTQRNSKKVKSIAAPSLLSSSSVAITGTPTTIKMSIVHVASGNSAGASDLRVNDIAVPPPRIIAPLTATTQVLSNQNAPSIPVAINAILQGRGNKKSNLPNKFSRSKQQWKRVAAAEGSSMVPQPGNKKVAPNTTKPIGMIESRQVFLSNPPTLHPPIPPVIVASVSASSHPVSLGSPPVPPAPPSRPRKEGRGNNQVIPNPPSAAEHSNPNNSGAVQLNERRHRYNRGRGGGRGNTRNAAPIVNLQS
ncbi:hypothetical protein EON65_10400 [archaeon]|nr:MAG: hypothetical protein EON65_10400 [archaeon]